VLRVVGKSTEDDRDEEALWANKLLSDKIVQRISFYKTYLHDGISSLLVDEPMFYALTICVVFLFNSNLLDP